jgi:hypothetical protein
MESALAPPARLIEYPNDLSGCDFVEIAGRRLLYMCPISGGSHFIVVLGYYAGQKEDVVVKDLIEPVDDSSKGAVKAVLERLVSPEFADAHVFFL